MRKKYWHFIKLMGRSASHIALECALQTHPNLALISEEVEAQQRTLREIVEEIATLVKKRAEAKKDFGIVLSARRAHRIYSRDENDDCRVE